MSNCVIKDIDISSTGVLLISSNFDSGSNKFGFVCYGTIRGASVWYCWELDNFLMRIK